MGADFFTSGRLRENERVKARRVHALALLVLFGVACRRSGDSVRDSVDALQTAVRARDSDAVIRHVSPSFRADDGSDRDAVREMLRRYFAAYEILNVSVRGLVVGRAEKAALARFTAELSSQPRKIGGLEGLLPSASTYRFELRYEPDDGRWKIVWASWKPVTGDR